MKCRVLIPRTQADLDECRRLDEQGLLASGDSYPTAEQLAQEPVKKRARAVKTSAKKKGEKGKPATDISARELEQLYDEIDAEIKKSGLPTEKKLAAEIEELNKTIPSQIRGTIQKQPVLADGVSGKKCEMKIIWKEWPVVPDFHHLGHGIHFHDQKKEWESSLVAFVEGYGWLHGNPPEVVVNCIKPDSISTLKVLNAMKSKVEELLRSKHIPKHMFLESMITRRILARING
jgi:hypothetical protein